MSSVAVVPALPSRVSSSKPRPALWRRVEPIVLGALIVISLLPVWRFKYIPSTDGGSHLENADVLLHYNSAVGSAYRQFYTVSYRPIPNSGGHYLLAALETFMPPSTAEKILVTLLLVGMPLTFRALLRAIRPGAVYLSPVGVWLSQSFFTHAGFYNFCLGVMVGFGVFAYWYRRRERMTWGRVVVLALLALVMYVCHLFATLLTVGLIAGVAGWGTLGELIASGSRRPASIWPGIRSRVVMTAFALLPIVVLALSFQFANKPGKHSHHLAIKNKIFWVDLLESRTFTSFGLKEKNIGLAATGFFVLLAVGVAIVAVDVDVARRPRLRVSDAMLAMAVVLVGLYFVMGDPVSVRLFVPRRLLLYINVALIAFVAGRRVPAVVRDIALIEGAAIALFMTTSAWRCYALSQAPLEEITLATAQIAPQSVILPLTFAASPIPDRKDGSTVFVAVYYTPTGAVIAQKHAIDFRNYEANTDYFPVSFRPELNPYTRLAKTPASFDDIPVFMRLHEYMQTTGKTIDYVLLWDLPPCADNRNLELSNPGVQRVLDQVRRDYHLAYTTPGGHAQLWAINASR